MRKEALKEILSNQRLNKQLLWNTMVLVTGGLIGLMFTIVKSKGILEIVLSILGVVLLGFILNLLRETNNSISKHVLQLNKED